MPIGNAYATGNIIAFIEQFHIRNEKLNVLDVGCGMGHNGFIFREMFEIRYQRLNPEQWMHLIEAIEIFRGYENPVWQYVYNKVMVGDCLKIGRFLEDKKYDIIFLTEILEHFEKEQVYYLLDELMKKMTDSGSIIITIPVGDEKSVLEQKDTFGNIHETHKSYLTIDDFDQYPLKHKVNSGVFMIGRKT